jgi:beta-glucosidase
VPPGQDELIRQIAAINKNVVLLITAGGAVEMTPWLDSVSAVLETWYPGQEGGRALAEVLFGNVNPSGRLPVTFERRWEDNPVHDRLLSRREFQASGVQRGRVRGLSRLRT